MRLNNLHNKRRDKFIALEYINKLNKLIKPTLCEGRKIITTVEIVDDEETTQVVQPIPSQPQIINPTIDVSETARNEFIEKAKLLGEFTNPTWVEQVVNGMKQVGVQGLDTVMDGDQPVTRNEMNKFVGLLVDLIRNK